MSIWEKYLEEYREVADEYLEGNVAIEYHKYFQEFFKKEKLAKYEWKDFQEMGNYIHAFNSMPLAKANALGRINHPIEHYRDVFTYLAHGDDPVEVRVSNFLESGEYSIKFFGRSACSEIIGYLFADKYLFMNSRDIFAAKHFKIIPDYDRGDSQVRKLQKFTESLMPVVEDYK